MIFLSHNSKDKPLVDVFASRLREKYGQNNVFYDSWSIQPGDGIIDKMNQGLTDANVFIYFVSENSINSKMVNLEWQNALQKRVKGELKMVPVLLDGTPVPSIMADIFYIDLSKYQLEVALTQLDNVIEGEEIAIATSFNNLVSSKQRKGNNLELRIEAKAFLEPISEFFFILKKKQEVIVEIAGESMFTSGSRDIDFDKLGSQFVYNLRMHRGITRDYPMIVNFKNFYDNDVLYVLKKTNLEEGHFDIIPLISKH